MARPKNAPGSVRTATIGVRVSPAEYERLKAKAAEMGMSPAQWLRRAALDRRLPPAPAAPVNLDTYRELARIGVNLNQAVAKIHDGSAHDIPREIIRHLYETLQQIQAQVMGGGHDRESE
jgi:hypothetical protein